MALQCPEIQGWAIGISCVFFVCCVSMLCTIFILRKKLDLARGSSRSSSSNSPDEERGAHARDAAAGGRRPFSASEAPPVHIHLNPINPWRRRQEEEEHAAPVDREQAPQVGSSQDTLVQPRLNSRHGSERGQTRAWW